LDELIPAGYVYRAIEAFVGVLDLSALGFEKAVPKAMGRPAHDPQDLLTLYL